MALACQLYKWRPPEGIHSFPDPGACCQAMMVHQHAHQKDNCSSNSTDPNTLLRLAHTLGYISTPLPCQFSAFLLVCFPMRLLAFLVAVVCPFALLTSPHLIPWRLFGPGHSGLLGPAFRALPPPSWPAERGVVAHPVSSHVSNRAALSVTAHRHWAYVHNARNAAC